MIVKIDGVVSTVKDVSVINMPYDLSPIGLKRRGRKLSVRGVGGQHT